MVRWRSNQKHQRKVQISLCVAVLKLILEPNVVKKSNMSFNKLKITKMFTYSVIEFNKLKFVLKYVKKKFNCLK